MAIIMACVSLFLCEVEPMTRPDCNKMSALKEAASRSKKAATYAISMDSTLNHVMSLRGTRQVLEGCV